MIQCKSNEDKSEKDEQANKDEKEEKIEDKQNDNENYFLLQVYY